MKLSASAIGAFLLVAATSTSTFHTAEAFTAPALSTRNTAFVPTTSISTTTKLSRTFVNRRNHNAVPSLLQMSYTVGIVGATGAVGKEIRQCLEKRGFPVGQLRIFGSERSAGKKVETEKYGTVDVELFDVKKARECDVVFLAVSGDFALEHAKAISDGDDGAVVIDNSVCFLIDYYLVC